MKKFDLGQSIQILANLGVLAGIAVLAVELRQNNDLLASQARANLDSNRVSQQRIIIENLGGVADLIYRSRNGETLTGVEQWRLTAHRSMIIHTFESMYQEVRGGPLRETDIPATQWVGVFSSDPGLVNHWNALKATLDPDFVLFVDENVLVPLATFPTIE